MDNVFSIGDSLKKGWESTKTHLGFLIGYEIILFFLVFIFSLGNDRILGILWRTLGFVVMVLVKIGLYNSALLIARNIKPNFDQLYINWRLAVSWIIANFLFGLMFVIGFLLLIVPGLYVLARFGLFPFALVDGHLGPIEALQESSRLTEGLRWKLLLLWLAFAGINILGALVFGIGLFITIPVTLLALAYVYRQIVAAKPIVI